MKVNITNLFLLAWLPVELMTGFQLIKYDYQFIPFSAIFKICFSIYMLVQVFQRKVILLSDIAVPTVLISILAIYHFISGISVIGTVLLSDVFLLLWTMLSVIFFQNALCYKRIRLLPLCLLAFISVHIYVAYIFKFGRISYKIGDIRVGSTGFFFEGNALNYLIILSTLSCFVIHREARGKLYFNLIVLSGILASKILLIYCVLIGILFRPKITLGIMVFILYVGFDYFNQLTVIQYYTDRLVEQSLVEVLNNGRFDHLSRAQPFLVELDMLQFLFGIGSSHIVDRDLSTELDFIDLIMQYGILGCTALYSLYSFMILKMVIGYREKFLFLAALLSSVFVGHFLTAEAVVLMFFLSVGVLNAMQRP